MVGFRNCPFKSNNSENKVSIKNSGFCNLGKKTLYFKGKSNPSPNPNPNPNPNLINL